MNNFLKNIIKGNGFKKKKFSVIFEEDSDF
jgi:hypothetical protein